jgi:hypothetical protein
MSNISSNALFHFTSSAENLIGILTNNFEPHYSFEEVPLNNEVKRGILSCAYPMVCFCDISLGQINNHVKTYGEYGIGMRKEWGVRKKLSPLIYVNEKSILADSFGELATHLLAVKNDQKTLVSFMMMSKFLKPYQGDFLRSGVIKKNVKFYDEREWRYIPDIAYGSNVKQILNLDDYDNPIALAQANNKLKEYGLDFSPADVKYIFIKDENEIHTMIEAIREIKGEKFDQKTVDILASKILTTKQLEEDF